MHNPAGISTSSIFKWITFGIVIAIATTSLFPEVFGYAYKKTASNHQAVAINQLARSSTFNFSNISSSLTSRENAFLPVLVVRLSDEENVLATVLSSPQPMDIAVGTTSVFSGLKLKVVSHVNYAYSIIFDLKDSLLRRSTINKNRTGRLSTIFAISAHQKFLKLARKFVAGISNKQDFNQQSSLAKILTRQLAVRVLLC